METIDFSQPSRQSSKGILIIFGFNVFKFFKRFFVVLLAFGLSLLKKSAFASLSPTVIVLILIAIVIAILVIAVLKFLNFKFHIKDDDFYLSTGIINKENTIIPKSKIQNVYIKQNFLQQVINVVSLKIETAGDNKSEIEISALDRPTALRLKIELFNKKTFQTETLEPVEEQNVFFKASVKRLLLEGISQNHIKSFAIMASFVVGVYYQFENYLEEFGIRQQIEDSVKINNESLVAIVLTSLFFMILVLVFSIVFSILKTFIVNFNLEVIENKKTVEINKGLLNKVSLSLTPSRIQNLVIKTNRLKRYLGLHTLSVNQAMTSKKQQKNFVIVALEQPQVTYLVERLLGDYKPAGEKQKPLLYYKRVLALRTVPLILLTNIGAVLLFQSMFWWVNLILIPFIVLFIHKSFQKAYYTISGEFITVGSGFIDTTTNILEIHKLQAIKFKQNIFQKRRKIASVAISTASKTVTIPYINEDDAKTINDFLLYKVESENRDWM